MNKETVIAAHKAHPALSAGALAKLLECGRSYVFETLKRNGFKAPKATKSRPTISPFGRLSIAEAYQRGEKVAVIAIEHGKSIGTVCKIAYAAGCAPRKPRRNGHG